MNQLTFVETKYQKKNKMWEQLLGKMNALTP